MRKWLIIPVIAGIMLIAGCNPNALPGHGPSLTPAPASPMTSPDQAACQAALYTQLIVGKGVFGNEPPICETLSAGQYSNAAQGALMLYAKLKK